MVAALGRNAERGIRGVDDVDFHNQNRATIDLLKLLQVDLLYLFCGLLENVDFFIMFFCLQILLKESKAFFLFIYDPDSSVTFFRHANFLSGIPILQMLSHVLLLPKFVVQLTDSVTQTIIPPWYECRYSVLAHKMHPYFSLFKPCQPSFDVVINPGRCWKQLKGTAFFCSIIRLHIHLYREAPDHSQFRMDLV